MGFKSSSFAMAQTIRFKRKSSRSSHSSRSAFFTPPATPFNNTSFLIQLQQHRQLHHRGSSTTAAFDQYGSMQTYMSIITCRNNPSASSGHSTTTSPDRLRAPISESPSTSQITPDSEREFSDPDGSHMCGSGSREMNSDSDGGASSVLVRSTRLEGDEGDGVQRHRHCRCFMDDNIGTQCADHLGSHNGGSKRVA